MIIKVLSTAKIDGGAYRWIKLPDGSSRVEEWHFGKGWKPGGADLDEFWFTPPVSREFAARMGIPWIDVAAEAAEEERAKAKLPARSPLTADELRRLIPGAPDTALAALVLRAQLIAHPDHWRPRLVVNNPRGDASSSKLSAKQLRQAISLGVKMAEADALLMLKRKARQVAELDRRRLRLVCDRDRITPPQV